MIFVIFDETLKNQKSEELLQFLVNNLKQESDVQTDINSKFNDSKPVLQT